VETSKKNTKALATPVGVAFFFGSPVQKNWNFPLDRARVKAYKQNKSMAGGPETQEKHNASKS
jgi:HD-like signal output (HDOD) protein